MKPEDGKVKVNVSPNESKIQEKELTEQQYLINAEKDDIFKRCNNKCKKFKYELIFLIIVIIIIIIISFIILIIKKKNTKISDYNEKEIIKKNDTMKETKKYRAIIGIYFGSLTTQYFIIKNNDIKNNITGSCPSELILDEENEE